MFEEYIPFIVGLGLFVGSMMYGVYKGKNDTKEDKKEVISGVIQDNYSMIMMSEQLRTSKEQMEKVIDAMRDLTNEIERLREYARDITKILETRKKM